MQRVERAHAEARIVAAARVRPAAVAVLAPGGERHHVGAAHRPAAAAEADIEGKANLVEIGGHGQSSLSSRPNRGGRVGALGWGRN
jgi:hypothetical protein